MITYEQSLRMARWMKKEDSHIKRLIRKTQRDQHGVVALKFSNECRLLEVVILDEPFDDNVRVYPG